MHKDKQEKVTTNCKLDNYNFTKDTGRLTGALDALMTEIDLLSEEASVDTRQNEKSNFYWNKIN